MKRSEYESYMDLLHIGETLCRALVCGLVLWEHIQRCEASGQPYTETGLDKAAQEAERRMSLFYSRIAQLSDEEAAADGGFSVTHFDNSS